MRILVLRALGLGDLLTAVPALRALRDSFPEARVELACPCWLHELVDVWALADETVAVEPLAPLPRAVSGPDLAVNLHGRGPESTRIVLAAAPRRLVAFWHADVPETVGSPLWRPREREVERWCRLLSESRIPADAARLWLPRPQVDGMDGARGATLIHPGASSEARRWPPERWAVVAAHERARGATVLLTGSRDDRERCVAIAAQAGLDRDSVLAGRTSPLELAALVGVAGLVVCGDTGVAHLATAFGTPSVVLFGPVSPAEWGPPPQDPRHRALWAGTEGDPHADTPDPGLLELAPERVLREIERVHAAHGRERTPHVSAVRTA